jgi:hypothetical protein
MYKDHRGDPWTFASDDPPTLHDTFEEERRPYTAVWVNLETNRLYILCPQDSRWEEANRDTLTPWYTYVFNMIEDMQEIMGLCIEI